jgi:hypothetical protein
MWSAKVRLSSIASKRKILSLKILTPVIKIDILFSFPHHYNEVQKDQQLYQFDAEKNKKCFTISYSVTKILNKILKYVILVYNFAASQEQ